MASFKKMKIYQRKQKTAVMLDYSEMVASVWWFRQMQRDV